MERLRSMDFPVDGASSVHCHLRVVKRAPTWRGLPYSIAYVFPDRELSADASVEVHRFAYREGLPNPRVIAPSVLQWSSLFNPRFFAAVAADRAGRQQRLVWQSTEGAPTSEELPRLWLESTLFLAGVTLSAAIVQGRYSSGTIASKYDRLWEAGTLADAVAPELRPLDLRPAVRSLAGDEGMNDVERLLEVRRYFMSAWSLIAPSHGHVEILSAQALPRELAGRFEFVNQLRERCGPRLHALIVYGSSVSSENFADYDLLVVVDDPPALLRALAGQAPSWQGREINLGVYSPGELIVMQRLSGDNLADYGLCLWGAVPVVRKSKRRLLIRNFSFGILRQRQQLGMLSRTVGDPPQLGDDDRRNLYDYFVKIPSNVAKGTLGVLGELWSKDRVCKWMISRLGFDAIAEQRRASQGDVALALAHSAIATGKVVNALNERVRLVASSTQKIVT